MVKNKSVNSNTTRKKRKKYKIIIFDLDETIGHFQELSILFNDDCSKNPKLSEKEIMYDILNNNPQVFRTKIFTLFSYLEIIKKIKKNIKILLFTNNQGPKFWYNNIVSFIHDRLKYKLFDKVIGPYKIGNDIVERKRTTHNKSVKDISKILKIPLKQMSIIIFDDQYHTNMNHTNVIYVHLNEYIPNMKLDYNKEYDIMRDELNRFLKKSTSLDKSSKTKKTRKIGKNKSIKNDKNYTKKQIIL